MKKQIKQTVDPVIAYIKTLSKQYKALNRDGIRIIYQFCQYNKRKTNKILAVLQQIKNPFSVIQAMLDDDEKSQQILSQLQKKYDQRHGKEEEIEIYKQETNNQTKKSDIARLNYNFFEHIPNDCITNIMSFFNPYEFYQFSITCKSHQSISQSEAQSDYYKNLCTKILKFDPCTLPKVCRFHRLKDYVLQKPQEFGPNLMNAVQNNIRQFIWKMDMNFLSIEPSYYKSFGSYYKLYKECPKINFNGYYVCRDKYIRIGQKNQKNPNTPIHIIYYYRYMRFLSDGSLIYHVRNKRLSYHQILKYLSKQILQNNENNETMLGQFVSSKERVFAKAVKSQQIFSYDLEIRSSDNQINNELRIQKYTLQLINNQQQIYQILYQTNPLKEDKYFEYFYHKGIQEQNIGNIKTCSL